MRRMGQAGLAWLAMGRDRGSRARVFAALCRRVKQMFRYSYLRLPISLAPPKPGAGKDMERELARMTEKIFDLLFSSGIGGVFILDDAQKRILREMRLASQNKTGLDISDM